MLEAMIDYPCMLIRTHEPRTDPHHRWRRPVPSHPNTIRRIIAIDPSIPRTRTDRTHHGHGNSEPNSNRHTRSRAQAARQKHHDCHCLFHLLTLLATLSRKTLAKSQLHEIASATARGPFAVVDIRRESGAVRPPAILYATSGGAKIGLILTALFSTIKEENGNAL
jgi:hypothetical protein